MGTNQVANQTMKLLNNEGRYMAKKHGRPIAELITDAELSVISMSIIRGLISKAEGRKLFCDMCETREGWLQ